MAIYHARIVDVIAEQFDGKTLLPGMTKAGATNFAWVKDDPVPIYEGTWIVKFEDGTIELMSDTSFKRHFTQH